MITNTKTDQYEETECVVGAISREFQRSPRQFFNARNFTCTCHIAAISEYNSVILLLGFTTSEMLHRCTTEAFLVQYFLNLILKDNNIVVCFCLMSNALAGSIFKTGGQYYSFIFV